MDITTAMSKISGYFQDNLQDQIVILVGKEETLISDLSPDVVDAFNSQLYVDSLGGPSHQNNLRHTEIITHYEEGTTGFIALPAEIQEAVKFINDLKITGKLKDGVAVEHVIGTATFTDIKLLFLHGYGVPLEITPNTETVYMFMSNKCLEFLQTFPTQQQAEITSFLQSVAASSVGEMIAVLYSLGGSPGDQVTDILVEAFTEEITVNNCF